MSKADDQEQNLEPNDSSEITFVIFTFNEERRIERVILNFMKHGRVLVVDNGSTDRTLEIANQYGCDTLINKNPGWCEDEVTTARVKAAVKTGWIYWGSADEMFETKTMSAVLSAIGSGRYDIINIARKNYYYGEFCYGAFADRSNRIFKKSAIDFAGNKIHQFGRVAPGSRICKLPSRYFVYHFISNTAKSYMQTVDRYTDVESTEDRPVPSIFRLILSSIKLFLLNLLFRGGSRAGAPGYYFTVLNLYYRWLSAMKLYEREFSLDRDEIERKNDEIRDKILESFQ